MLPTALGLLGVVLGFWQRDLGLARDYFAHDADHTCGRWADVIEAELGAVRSDLLYLAEQQATAEYASHGGDEGRRGALAEELRRFCGRRGLYDQIRYLDAAGWERIRINHRGGAPEVASDAELQFKGERYYFHAIAGLEREQVYVSPFDLNVEYERLEEPWKPMIRFGTPVFDHTGQKSGVLILNYLGARLLRALDQAATSFRGRMFLLDQAGHLLHGPADRAAEAWGFMFGREPIFPREHPQAWARVSAQARGALGEGDGLYAFETIAPSPAPESHIRVVAHVPAALLSERADGLLARLLAVWAGAVVAVATLARLLARARRTREQARERLKESEARLRELSQRLLGASEAERRSLSRDLHDDLGQILTALCIDLDSAARHASGPKQTEALERARVEASALLERLHELAARLRPPLLDDLGLEEAVKSCLAELERRTGIEVRAVLALGGLELAPEASENLYRILQEALTNATRHARARQLEVELVVRAGRASLVVKDDGVGFDAEAAAKGPGLGLVGIRERAELLGGTCRVESSRGKGTTISIDVPALARSRDATTSPRA